MNYTISRVCILTLIIFAGSGLQAKNSAAGFAESELANARALIQAGRKEIIREDLHLTRDEAAAFWPLYEMYRGEVLAVLDRHADLITDYVQTYDDGNLTNKYADSMLGNYFEIKSDLLRIQKKYLRRYRKILPSLKVARFYQLENKMNAHIEAELALAVPLVEPN